MGVIKIATNVSEKTVERMLVQGVKRMGGIAYKWVSPGNDGVPDRVVVLPGALVDFVELKTKRGRLSAIQVRQHERLRKCGFNPITLYGAEDVEKYLQERQALLEASTEELMRRGYQMMGGEQE